MSKFELYRSESGGYRWQLKASNGEVVASSAEYTTKEHAKAGCDAARRAARDAVLVEP